MSDPTLKENVFDKIRVKITVSNIKMKMPN